MYVLPKKPNDLNVIAYASPVCVGEDGPDVDDLDRLIENFAEKLKDEGFSTEKVCKAMAHASLFIAYYYEEPEVLRQIIELFTDFEKDLLKLLDKG